MTTHTTLTRVRHDSDATFREWIQEMEAAFAAIGLVQTADTGQINTATANRPAVSVSAGYQIWRFNDTMQATAPIFLRIEYRTAAGGATFPLISIGVGTGTNGAGTLTGTASFAPAQIAAMNVTQVTDTTRPSYWCHTGGMFAMNWKVGTSQTEAELIIARIVDNTGAPTADGAIFITLGVNSLNARYLRFGAGAAVSALINGAPALNLCHWPFDMTTSIVGSDPQVATAWAPMPRYMPVVGIVGVLDVDFPPGTTFSFTAVGTTAHTYFAGTNFASLSSNSRLKAAFLWE